MNRRFDIHDIKQAASALELIRKRVCSYTQDPCDCKFGISDNGENEATGCCELREIISIMAFVPDSMWKVAIECRNKNLSKMAKYMKEKK